VLVTCLPAGAALVTLSASALAVVQPAAIDYAEPVVYGQAARLLAGQALYQPIDQPPYTVAAYTPLYYWAAAALQVGFGPGFGPGRTLSLVCGAASALLMGWLAGRRAGRLSVGAFAGLLFLAFGFPRPDTPWMGLYRVDVLGVALSLAAVAVLSGTSSTRGVVTAGVLAGLALLCKQTCVAALVAGALWLWPRPGLFVASALITFAIPCVVLEATTGAFLQNAVLANVNPFYPSVAAMLLKEYIKVQWLPLGLAAVYLGLGRPWRESPSRLLLLYWLASAGWVIWIGKIGANHNYWIEFAAATAILAASGVDQVVSASRLKLALAGTAGVIVVLSIQLGGPLGLIASARQVRADLRSVRTTTTTTDLEFDALVQRVREEPGAVLADPMDVVVLAGRQVELEPFIYSVLMDTGHWRADPLVARICNREISLAVLSYSLEVAFRMTDGLHSLWPVPVLTAMRDNMTLDGIQAQRYVYSVRPAPAGQCLSSIP
jgi:hypothetical protein